MTLDFINFSNNVNNSHSQLSQVGINLPDMYTDSPCVEDYDQEYYVKLISKNIQQQETCY